MIKLIFKVRICFFEAVIVEVEYGTEYFSGFVRIYEFCGAIDMTWDSQSFTFEPN